VFGVLPAILPIAGAHTGAGTLRRLGHLVVFHEGEATGLPRPFFSLFKQNVLAPAGDGLGGEGVGEFRGAASVERRT
ncbi:MAG TPA: hypothetical protein VGF49_20410, partial [Candidatus Solibacter sp.]